jgi:hypothetical protein
MNLHFRALGESSSPSDEKSFGVAHDHIVRLHDRQGVELILPPFDKKMVGLGWHTHARVPESGPQTGRQPKIGKHAIRRRDLAFYVFAICTHFDLLLLL